MENYAEKDAIFFLIGNKADLSDQRQVPQTRINDFCQQKKLHYMECSAKEGDNIKGIFIELARKLEEKLNIKAMKAPEKKGGTLNQPVKSKDKKCC